MSILCPSYPLGLALWKVNQHAIMQPSSLPIRL